MFSSVVSNHFFFIKTIEVFILNFNFIKMCFIYSKLYDTYT